MKAKRKSAGYPGDKAVSPVFSALIMTAVVASAFGVLYVFTQNYTSSQTMYYLQYFQTEKEKAQERFIIEDVWFITDENQSPTNQIKIYLRNVGRIEVDIRLKDILNGEEYYYVVVGDLSIDSLNPSNLSLNPNEHTWLTITLKEGSVWEKDTQYYVKVESVRRNTVEGYYVSPK